MSFFGGDNGITVTNNIPKNMVPGSEVAIEVKVAKGNQSGFAKLQLDLPAGISVKEIDNAGANYSLGDGVAKWVWASLPSDAEITVKCYLVIEKDASGQKTIGGKYSYVENNAKVVVEMSPVDVTLGGDATAGNTNAAETNTASQNTNTETAVNTNTTAPTNTETTQTFTTPNTNSEPAGNITVQRTITKGNSEGEYNIDLKINKGLTKGFARYSDDLPADLSARAGKTEGASFSVSDGKIKFVWVNAPEQEVIEISYIISGVKSAVTLKGEYSYLEQNLSKGYNLPAETITPDATAANTNTESANTNTETAANTNTSAANTNTESTAQTNTQTSEPTTTITGNVMPKTDGNVKFMVQIGAFTSSNVSAGKLKRKFNISENVISEMQGGYSKFMVGNHGEYKGARDHRERVKSGNGVASAFVVAYNTGRRITVQEALMITNQRWFR